MNDKPVPTEPDLINCKLCFKEIPESVATTEEGEDYVMHFCGLECYSAWKEKNKNVAAND